MKSHNPNNYEVIAKNHIVGLDKQSSLEAWTITTPDGDDLVISVVMYHMSGVGFSATDWQGWQPQTVDEVRDHDWISFGGQGAVLLSGLPTLFA